MSRTIAKAYECLNLGCGDDYRSDWFNVDIDPAVDPDIVHDLNEYPWPFADDEFQHVEARHVLEHVADPQQALTEIARILRPTGSLLWVYPIGHTRFEDPTHKHYWNYWTPETVCGDREHSHETDLPFTVVGKDVSWSADSLFWQLYVRLKERLQGYGPWLSQIPGLYGEIEVTLRRES